MTYSIPSLTIGIDLGDRYNAYAMVDAQGEVRAAAKVANTREALHTLLAPYAGARMVIETGTHSPWVSRLGQELGLEVLVSNSRKLRAIYQSPTKSDVTDAQLLARCGRLDPQLLCPVVHRGAQAQAHLAMLKARDQLVAARSSLIAHVRSQVKGVGERLGTCSAPAFHRQAQEDLPEELRPALAPLLETIATLTGQIHDYDQQLAELAAEFYPETAALRQVKGVGLLTSLAFVLTIENPARFADPRDVGAWLGLVPRRDQSGNRDPDLGITKAGNHFLRRLLMESAHYILGPFGEDCDLRRHGLRVMDLPPEATAAQIKRQTGKAKNRAAVAVARKLAVLLLALWRHPTTPYQRLRHTA